MSEPTNTILTGLMALAFAACWCQVTGAFVMALPLPTPDFRGWRRAFLSNLRDPLAGLLSLLVHFFIVAVLMLAWVIGAAILNPSCINEH